MRQLLSSAVSAVLLSTAACVVSEPVIIRSARTAAPAARPADTKVATESADTKDATGSADPTDAAGPADTADTASGAADEVVIPAGWSLVTSPRGGFRAAFPSSPEVKEQLLKTDSGYVRMISYGVPSRKDDSYLMVIVGQYPDGSMSGKPADQLLTRAGDYTLAQNKFTLVSAKDVRVDGARGSGVTFPGRDIEATEGPTGKRISIRMILVHDRVYQVLFLRDGEKAEPFQQFLSTFELR
jgi:hypothetical protein